MERWRLRAYNSAMASLHTNVQVVADNAVIVITRQFRVWHARRQVAKIANLRRSVQNWQWRKDTSLLRRSWQNWKGYTRIAQRLKLHSTSSWKNSPPHRKFWQLFPSDGKAAVA